MIKENSSLPQVIFEGEYSQNDITAEILDSQFFQDERFQEDISTMRNEKEEEAKIKNLNFYNGISYRFVSYHPKEKKVILEKIDFKNRWGSIQLIRNKTIDEYHYRHNGCFAWAHIQCSDGKYIVLKLNGRSMNTNTFEIVGGMVEKLEYTIENIIFDTIYKEVEEEILVTRSEITSCVFKSGFFWIQWHVGFHFNITLNIPSTEIFSRAKNIKDKDIEEVIALSKEEYITFLKEHNSKNKNFIIRYLDL